MNYAIATQSLSRSFDGKPAVDGIDLRVERGVLYGFLGPNGAGKSTTIKMLTGLLAPSAGTATLLGYDLARDSIEIKRRTGVVPEDHCLFENLTAREYLTFIGRMYRLPEKTLQERSEELLTLMGLGDCGKKLVLEFSHGMKKKLALSAALIHDPELLFLDEPFEGIDPVASRAIRSVLEQAIHRGATVFLTSHILEIVERLCSQVGIICKGRLVAQGPLSEVAAGSTLEQVFVTAVGEPLQPAQQLHWLSGGSGEEPHPPAFDLHE